MIIINFLEVIIIKVITVVIKIVKATKVITIITVIIKTIKDYAVNLLFSVFGNHLVIVPIRD